MDEDPRPGWDAELIAVATEAGLRVLTLMTAVEVGHGKSVTLQAFGETWLLTVERLEQ